MDARTHGFRRALVGALAAAVASTAAATDAPAAEDVRVAYARQLGIEATGASGPVAATPLVLLLEPVPPDSLALSPLAPSAWLPGPAPDRWDVHPPSRFRPGGLALPVGETLATNAVVMGWNRWVGEAPWAEVSWDTVGRNLRSGWVLDTNPFWVNQFGHPYQGTWSFTAARSSGLGFWGSTPFTFGASALWELAGETERPALNDQITTTVAGIALGEILHRFSGALLAEGGRWNEAAAFVLSPWGAVNRRALGTSGRIAAPPSRFTVAAGGAAFRGPSSRHASAGYGGLSFVYGVPGDPDLELDRPFDHFVLDVGWTAWGDPDATVRARGVLGGATFDEGGARGLYGVWLSFDFDTPPGHRISTSAVGVGGSAVADLGRGLALEGDAIVSAVLLGAAGTVDRGPDGLGRDYRFGPGQQALLGLTLRAGTRASAGVSLRQYLVVAADGAPGTEVLLDGTAHALVRVTGRHGVGIEASRYVRRASVGPSTAVLGDSAFRVYWAYLGGAATVAAPVAPPDGSMAGSTPRAPRG